MAGPAKATKSAAQGKNKSAKKAAEEPLLLERKPSKDVIRGKPIKRLKLDLEEANNAKDFDEKL